MPKIPLITGDQLIKTLSKHGFTLNRVKGSHHILVNSKTQITISIPVHKGRELGRGITLAIIKDAQIPLEEFLKSLK